MCVSNAACPPHALRQACEEQRGLGTATPGSPLQTTATNVQIERQVNIHGNNLLTPAQAWALLSSTEWPPIQLLQGTDASTNSVFMMLHQEAVPLRAATASWESKSRMLKKSVHVSGEQDICPTVRHSDWSNAKPVHKWTHSRLKPTKIQTVKKCPECILRGSAKPLLWVAWPLPSPAQKDVLQDDLREHCYQHSAQRAETGPHLVSEMEKHPFTACLQGLCASQPAIFKQ